MQSRAFARSALVCILMCSVAALSVLAVPEAKFADTRQSFDLNTAVPEKFGDWRIDRSSIPLPPSPDQQAILNEIYDQILSRTYVNSKGDRMMLSITYGSRQNQQLRAHRQEVCYSAQGFKISRLERKVLPVSGVQVPLTRMLATQYNRVEPVTYWFTMGDTVVLSYLDRELQQLKFALSGYVPDGYLVRVSNLSANVDQSFEGHLAFASELMAHLDGDLRRRLIGARI
ncbi:MAG: EpsI family protein [Burkholderiales bacterium PBB4]|nr:MAG: EpsI family protein [Burkholderiales bacterium PBB4]